jgi:predicted aconitase with swiveling domain
MNMIIHGRVIIAGAAEGQAVLSEEPLSFWGGINPYTGEITDRRHDHYGVSVAGKVFLFPKGRGSSTGSAVLLESIRNGKAPAAIINLKEDPILALGAIVSDELYKKTITVLVISREDCIKIREGDFIRIEPDGSIYVTKASGY